MKVLRLPSLGFVALVLFGVLAAVVVLGLILATAGTAFERRGEC
jgi:hypothetical protein